MKKISWASCVFAFLAGLILSYGAHPAMAEVKRGGIFKFNFSRPASSFGVPVNIRHWNHEYTDHVCQNLIRPSHTKIGSFEPVLATSWELAPDKSYYIFKLRKGVKFHDGTDFNAQAVKWNLDQWVKAKRAMLDKVRSVDVIDDYTVRCNLSGWDSVLIDDFSLNAYMISPTTYEKHGEKWADAHPIGTGPFKLKEFRRNEVVKFERFDGYWEKGLPYLDGIEILQITDPMTAIAAFKKGEVDALVNVDTITANELKAAGNSKVDSIPALHQVIVMNSTNPESVWSDKRMREALEYAVDKESIAKSLGYGFVYPVYEIVHSCPGNPGTVPRKYNPDKARQLIREAGHQNGVKVVLTVQAEMQQDFYVAVQENLAAAGIKAELNPVKGAALFQMSFEPAKGSDLRVELQRGGAHNPLRSVKETLSETSIYFPGLKRPKGFNDLVNQALGETQWEKIVKLLEQMDKLAYEDMMFVPLFNKPIIHVMRPFVNDAIWFWAGSPYPHLERAWLNKK